MILKRIFAFLLDLFFAGIFAYVVLFPIGEFFGEFLAEISPYTKIPKMSDLGEVYLLLVLIYTLILLPFSGMPFRFFLKGKSLGSAIAEFHIQNTETKDATGWMKSCLRSPGLLILGPTAFLHFINYVILMEFYPDGPFGPFLSLHFSLLFISIFAFILLIIEWISTLADKNHQSFAEKWTRTKVELEKK